MSSSRGFGSTPRHKRPIRTRFRYGSAYHWLNLAAEGNSPARSTKSTPSPRCAASCKHRAPTERKRRVSGLFHPPCGALFTFPSRYLCTIGHREYLALDGGPPSFPPNSTCWVVLRCCIREQRTFGYGALTHCGRPSQAVRLAPALVTLCAYCRRTMQSYNPRHTKPAGHMYSRV